MLSYGGFVMTALLRAAVPSGRRGRTWLGLAGIASLIGSGLLATAPAATAASSTLVRYPYLTDVTTTSVQVTFDTITKVTSASGAVQWGTPSGSTGCTLTGKS